MYGETDWELKPDDYLLCICAGSLPAVVETPPNEAYKICHPNVLQEETVKSEIKTKIHEFAVILCMKCVHMEVREPG